MRHRVCMCVTFYDQIQDESGKEENPIFGSYSNLILPSVFFQRSRDLDGRREKIAFIDSHTRKISFLAEPLAMPSPPEAQPELLPRLPRCPFFAIQQHNRMFQLLSSRKYSPKSGFPTVAGSVALSYCFPKRSSGDFSIRP